MAATHFLVLPTTNAVFTWRVVNTVTNRIVSRHRNLRLALEKAERLNVEAAGTALLPDVQEEFSRCGHMDDSSLCGEPATVTDIETGCTFCMSHFREVIL